MGAAIEGVKNNLSPRNQPEKNIFTKLKKELTLPHRKTSHKLDPLSN
jgi:hypothetical protein